MTNNGFSNNNKESCGRAGIATAPLVLKHTETADSDARLLDDLRKGDEKAYAALVQSQAGLLLKTARRYLGDGDAPDAVQDAFLKAFQAIDGFSGASSIGTWLHRILINCCLMQLRKSKSSVEVSIDTLLPSFQEDGHRANPSSAWPDTCAERHEVVSVVSAGIQQLPESYRTVLMLRDIDGFTGAETAKLLDISLSLVKVRLHRARQALRELIDPTIRSELWVQKRL